MASYEPLVSDVSVSVKFLDEEPLPNAGAVCLGSSLPGGEEAPSNRHPRWSVRRGAWYLVNIQEVHNLVPHATLHTEHRVGTFRVFQTGSVVQVGRWPCSMEMAQQRFLKQMLQMRKRIIEGPDYRQRTMDEYLTRPIVSMKKEEEEELKTA